MESTGSINYKVCNIGSVYNKDNSETCNMPGENRFKFYINVNNSNNYSMTSLPCYLVSNSGHKTPSLDSKGRVNSSYYPAINNQFALTPLIHVTIH